MPLRIMKGFIAGLALCVVGVAALTLPFGSVEIGRSGFFLWAMWFVGSSYFVGYLVVALPVLIILERRRAQLSSNQHSMIGGIAFATSAYVLFCLASGSLVAMDGVMAIGILWAWVVGAVVFGVSRAKKNHGNANGN